MQNFLTGDDIFAHILLLRNAESKAYVVVEGPTDCAMLDPHIHEADFTSIAGNGKSTVIRVMEIVHAEGVPNVAGILDRDLQELVGESTNVPDVFFTDLYDMEAVAVLDEKILARVVSAVCDRDRVQGFESVAGRPLRQALIEVAFIVSYLRYVSVRDGLELKLRGFPIHGVLTADSRVDGEAFAKICVSRSGGSSVDSADVLAILNRPSVPDGITVEQMCCGHDLVESLSAIGSRFLGSAGSSDHLHRVFRAALDCATFLATNLAYEVDDWAKARGLKVWACV